MRQIIPNRLHAISTEPDVGLEPLSRKIISELKLNTQLTEPPRCP